MDEKQIKKVAGILQAWNPLGERAAVVADLDGYKTEAIDIIFAFNVTGGRTPPAKLVMQTLNGAFDLFLSLDECEEHAQQIVRVLRTS